MSMKVHDIRIEDIKILENVRVSVKKLQGLMADIQQHGLYNPIKVMDAGNGEYVLVQGHRRLSAVKKLGWVTIPATVTKDMKLADLLVNNMAENVHREDITLSELGRICQRLKDEFEMTTSEIAARLSVSKDHVENALRNYKNMPEKYRDLVNYTGRGQGRMGNIPAGIAMRILSTKRLYGLDDASVEKLLKLAKVEEYGAAELFIISNFLKEGYKVDEAVERAKDYSYTRHDVVVEDEEIQRLMKKHGTRSKTILLDAIVYGELPPLKRPSWLKQNKSLKQQNAGR